MEKLIQLLLTLIQKAPFSSEAERDAAIDDLRDVEAAFGVTGEVPPPASDQPTPAPAPPAVEPPGPVAEPVPADQQTPPPVSPDVAVGDVEATNAFSQAADDVPGSP